MLLTFWMLPQFTGREAFKVGLMCSCVWCFATCDKRAGKTARSSNRNRIAHRENSTLSMWLIVQQSGLLALLELLPKKPNCTRQTGCSLYQINFRNKLLENEDSDQFSRSTHSVGIQKKERDCHVNHLSIIDDRRSSRAQNSKRTKFNLKSMAKSENELIHCHCKDFFSSFCKRQKSDFPPFYRFDNNGNKSRCENNKSTLETKRWRGNSVEWSHWKTLNLC